MTTPAAHERGDRLVEARRILATLLLASIAGAVAKVARVPLPWMIGPLFAVAIGNIAGLPLRALPGGRQQGQWAIGTSLGLYFSPAVIAQLVDHALLVVAAAIGSLLFGMLAARFMMLFGDQDRPTAFFASLPGGASEMATLAERWGGAVDRIATAHALRVMMVVSVVPFALTLAGAHGGDVYQPLVRDVIWQRLPWLLMAGLAGAAVFALLNIANAWILGPLAGVALATALGVSLSALPAWVVAAGQVLIGCSLGCRFSPQFFRAAPRFMAIAAAVAMLGLLLAFGMAVLFSFLTEVPLPTLALAVAPGGVAEMCITAKVLQLGVPLVTACHVLRVAMITFGAPFAYRWFNRTPRA